jgi:hypothetical protein
MTIDDAIEVLNGYKKNGTKSIVMITMTADNVWMEDDEAWAYVAATAENDSRILDSVTDAIENTKEEEGYVEDEEDEDKDLIEDEE